MNSVLMKAILAMDSYNRGYGQGIEITGNQVGRATISSDSITMGAQVVNGQTVRDDENISFYGIAYDYDANGDLINDETIIAYRGTDNLLADANNG